MVFSFKNVDKIKIFSGKPETMFTTNKTSSAELKNLFQEE